MTTSGPADVSLVNNAGDADCVIDTSTEWHFGKGGRIFGAATANQDGPPRLVWDGGDRPTGKQPGFFCSLPRDLFDPRRHRTFCYPIRYNECIAPNDLGDARLLFSFVGGITSGVRSRLVESLRRHGRSDEMELIVQGGPWGAMFDRTGVPTKVQYAECLRRTRFFLCPRGNGVGSVRLFETMQAARVPVIISDNFVLPHEIDWDACAVIVKERDLAGLPARLRALEPDWPTMAANARRVWENHFSEQALLGSLGRATRVLLATDTGESSLHRLRVAKHWGMASGRRHLGALRALIR